jgi:mercuric ion transport protein
MLLRKPVGNLRAYLLLGSALLCLCHLPVLLALVAGGLGGGAAAGFLGRNMPLVLVLATGYFVFALWLDQRLLRRQVTPSAPRAGRHDDCC